MFNWLFGARKEKDTSQKIKIMESTLKESFNNIKKDIDKLFEHVEKTNSKHIKHEEDVTSLHKRLLYLEEKLFKEYILNKNEDIESDLELDEENNLTEISQKICMILAALSKENSEKFIPLKILAEEMYPDKKYQTIRSTISQYTTELEKLGYIQKKKRGRQVYLRSTDKNPYTRKKIKGKVNIKN